MSITKQNKNSLLRNLQLQVEQAFRRKFGRTATVVVAAPGRVNLIGEHIDFNDGIVLPMAIERYVVIAAAPTVDTPVKGSPNGKIQIHSLSLDNTETFSTNYGSLKPGRKGWASYVEGVMFGFSQLEQNVPPFEAMIGSSVPVGGGLSSSAALEVATATLLEELANHKVEPRAKALLCQTAEQEFAGVPCGIMDQFSSVFGQSGKLMLIDCQSQALEFVSFPNNNVAVLITNTNVQHELTGGEYADRRTECESALSKLGETSWRNVTLKQIEGKQSVLSETEFRRARHVVLETKRTVDAADAFREGDWDSVGKLMYASHDSLRDDFEVSCKELDLLVEIAKGIGDQHGVIGSRMTGGGFGGCTISLVKNTYADSVVQTLMAKYRSETSIDATCFASRPASGAQVLKCDREG